MNDLRGIPHDFAVIDDKSCFDFLELDEDVPVKAKPGVRVIMEHDLFSTEIEEGR